MGWVRNDDDMLDHEKWRRAIRHGGDGALLVWMRLTSWCSRRLTDGEVPADMVDEVAEVSSRTRERALQALVDASLLAWCDPAEDTADLRQGAAEPLPRPRRGADVLVVVGYLQRNPSRASVYADRDRRAKAQKNYEDRKKLTGSVSGQGPIGRSGLRSDPDDVPSRPVPSRPVPTPEDPPVSPPEGDHHEPHPPDVAPPNIDAADAPPDAAPPDSTVGEVREVFVEWQRVHCHPDAKLDAKRTARIKRALKLQGVAQLKQAIRGALKDDWLMGRDPKSPRKYDGLETLLRDEAQIERLIELDQAPPSARRLVPATGRSRDPTGVFAYALQRITEEEARERVAP